MAKETKERKAEGSEQEKKKLPERLEEFRKALEEEINTIERDGLSSTLLRRGRPLSSDGVSNRYSFDVDYLPAMPADTPCKLIVGKNTYAYLADAIRATGINSKSIRDAANGVQQHAGGYRWKYKDEM